MPEKKVNIEVINRVARPDLYEILDGLIADHHCHLEGAQIALVWRTGWKKDKDGHLKLGQCKKASDLDRRLSGFDFAILLNREVWNAADFTSEQQLALIDHELCHAECEYDTETGELLQDEDGKTCYRIRKHDIEEFSEVVMRHGLWRKDLEAFARVALARAEIAAASPLLFAVEKV